MFHNSKFNLRPIPLGGAAAIMRNYSEYAKSLILLLIAASFILGLSQGVPEVAPGQPVVGEITLCPGSRPNAAIIAPMEISGWNLVPGKINQQTGILHVHASGKWQISISADPNTGGHMTEYASAYGRSKKSGYVEGGERLKNSMKVYAQGYNEVDLTQGGLLIPRRPAGEYDIPITFSQYVAWNDRPLIESHGYHIIVNFFSSPVQ
jgi:hypothetical protein